MQIFINDEQNEVLLKQDMESLIEKVVVECLEIEQMETKYEVSITFVDDKEIRKLNKEYRGIDKSTDVLSFPLYDENEVIDNPLLGDIVISLETAKRQSKDFGHTIEREVMYLTAHSMFHLLGYDHMENDDKKLMREKEKQAMKNLGIFKGDNN